MAKAFKAIFDEVPVQPLALRGASSSWVPRPTELLWGHEGPAGALADTLCKVLRICI